MREQGLSLDKYASRDVKVLVVANPANTNMLVLLKTVKKIPKKNFSCLTRLDEERLRYFIAEKINKDLNIEKGNFESIDDDISNDVSRIENMKKIISAKDIKNVFIFGNHSTTQVFLLL